MKTLKQLLSKTKASTDNFSSSTKDLEKFVGQHEIEVVADANGNDDEVFKGSKVKAVDREKERHGYTAGKDAEAYKASNIAEGEEAHAQFQKYHTDTAKLLKGINSGLMKHYDNVTNKKNFNNGQAHWGHVGDIKHIHRQLQDIHDSILQQGEYEKPLAVKMKEEAEQIDELSKATLGSYVKKATSDVRLNTNMSRNTTGKQSDKFAAKAWKREDNVGKAVDRMTTEDVDQVNEKTLTPAEMKKREEVAKAIERENPKMPMSKKMAIATATAKKVAEEVEEESLAEDFIDLYFALDEESREYFISLLDDGKQDELLEFVETLGESLMEEENV